MSDDDGDIIVVRVCAGVGCGGRESLVFDEVAGQFYCPFCTKQHRAADEDSDYDAMLSHEDRSAVLMIFRHFAVDDAPEWTFSDFNRYMDATAAVRREVAHFDSDSDFADYVMDEYGVNCQKGLNGESVLTVMELYRIYGGYAYHGISALRKDLEALEDNEGLNTAALE